MGESAPPGGRGVVASVPSRPPERPPGGHRSAGTAHGVDAAVGVSLGPPWAEFPPVVGSQAREVHLITGRRVGLAELALVLGLGVGSGLGACARVGAPDTEGARALPPSVADVAAAADSCPATRGEVVVDLVNRRRASAGLEPLRVDLRLVAAAQAHAEDLVGLPGVPGHEGSDGSAPSDRATRADYSWVRIGENVASGTPTASTVVALWMNSRGHRHNILTPEFTDAGVGVVDAKGSAWGTYWVMMYGTTGGAPGASVRCHP